MKVFFRPAFFPLSSAYDLEGILSPGGALWICYQWFSFSEFLKRFKVDRRFYGFVRSKTEYEPELCTNNEHVITKSINFY